MEGSVVFVATQSDVLQPHEIRRALNLHQDATVRECAAARNKFTSERVASDFLDGLIEMATAAGDTVDRGEYAQKFKLPVFTVSSMDFQKISGLRSDEDGGPDVWMNARGTQIPKLRSHILATTNSLRGKRIARQGASLKRLLAGLESFAQGAPDVSDAQRALCRSAFENSAAAFGKRRVRTREAARKSMLDQIMMDVIPSLKEGASHACADASATAEGWRAGGSRLHWATYKATVRREGAWRLDMNSELAEPILTAVSTRWERTFVSGLRGKLEALRVGARDDVRGAHRAFEADLRAAGITSDLKSALDQQLESSDTLLSETVDWCTNHVSEQQKELSRSIVPFVKVQMMSAYSRAFAEKGTGSHVRRWGIVETHIQSAKEAMFVNSIKPISDATVPLVKELVKRLEVSERQALEDLRLTFSVYWETPGVETQGARLRLLPQLVALKKTLEEVNGGGGGGGGGAGDE